MSALRVLAIVPEPVDVAWSAAAASAWSALEQSLRALGTHRVELSRLAPCTASALEAQLAHESFHVIHVLSRGTSRPAAKHGTLVLETSDRRARDYNAQNFARVCAAHAGLELVVVQALDTPSELGVLCDALAAAGPVIHASTSLGSDGHRFSFALYVALAAGESVGAAFAAAERASALGSDRSVADGARLISRAPPSGPPTPGAAPRRVSAAPCPKPAPDSEAPERTGLGQRQLAGKRASGAFDVFLCHNVADKPAVAQIGRQLMQHGVLPWLDEWELRPGLPWQRLLEDQINTIRTAAVFVGPGGIGPWQRHELDGFLREFNTRGCPVIPVLLPSAGPAPELPLFLRGITWVDFRALTPDPIAQLLWGITGVKAT